MKIGSLEIGGNAPVAVISEVGNAHNGDFGRAIRILDAIKAAGASAAKFQCYLPEELIALRGDGPAPAQWGEQGWTMRSLYEKAATPFDWFPELVAHCGEIGLPWFSSVFGPDSFTLLESIGCPCYKLAALDFGSTVLRDLVLKTDRPVIRSCNYDMAPSRLPDSLTLYAPEGYPQSHAHLRNLRNGYDGYSYHGTNPSVPTMAVVAGAKVIEVHVQLDNEPSELEANVSLTMTQLAILVRGVRYAESML